MENNLMNKSKFACLYWGQDVYKVCSGGGRYYRVSSVCASNVIPCASEIYLELAPLSSITDEDRDEICNKYATHIGEFIDPDHFHFVILDIQDEQFVLDYLRSRGYALPFMGLSVEELVKRNWIKLK